jgi:hypothetical protein
MDGGSAVRGLGASRFSGLATSRSIGEPLADCALNRPSGARTVIDAEGNAVAVAEIEFSKIAVQMPLVAVLINTLHPALEDAEPRTYSSAECRTLSWSAKRFPMLR